MPRYEFYRDHRNRGGPRLSIVISTEPTHEKAAELFEERWQQKVHEHNSTKAIQATAMTPEALAVKRTTQGMKG